jgi:hypothetical protein
MFLSGRHFGIRLFTATHCCLAQHSECCVFHQAQNRETDFNVEKESKHKNDGTEEVIINKS